MDALTNLKNVVVEGCTIENRFGETCHAEFLDDVYPDRTCGQYDRGILVVVYECGIEVEYFISFSDASVWHDAKLVDGARCREVAVQVALMDAREPYLQDEHWLTFSERG